MAFPLTRAVVGLLLTVAALNACGDDGDGNPDVAVGEVVTVTAVDYGYRGPRSRVAAKLVGATKPGPMCLLTPAPQAARFGTECARSRG